MRFSLQQRVRITGSNPFRGFAGTVVRLTYQHDRAWIELDDWPAGEKRVFEKDGGDEGRRNWMMFYDNECEAVV